MFKCPTCGKEFEKQQSCASHMKIHREDFLEIRERVRKTRTLERITIVKNCLKCNQEFFIERKIKNGIQSILKKERKYCSYSCANGHPQTQEQNKKRSEKLSKTKIEKIKPKREKKTRKKYSKADRVFRAKVKYYCSVCNKLLSGKTKTGFCKNCLYKDTNEFVKFKHLCAFKFNVYLYPEEFDLDLLKTHGWYSATNRGNNAGGVSRDHMISIRYGFDNNIPQEILSHPANCELLLQRKNVSKYYKCSITLDELIEKISKWESKYGKVK